MTMKMNETNRNETSRFSAVCLASCRKLIEGVEKAKQAIAREFRDVLGASDHLIHLALNEAESLAWQTDYPHLVFPALATEKVQALANWQARQRSIREHR